MTTMTWTIEADGDEREKYCWPLFIAKELPSYQAVWARYIVPLTRRPANIRLKSDAELSAIGKSVGDICFAQLHYSVLCHLHAAFEIGRRLDFDFDGFSDAIVRLCSAQDVAFELLERHRKPTAYDVASEDASRKARSAWQNFDKGPLTAVRPVREYRNRLVHGRVPPWWRLRGKAVMVPRIGSEGRYLDWRRADGPELASGNPEFAPASEILDFARAATVGYLEAAWQKHLL